MSKRSRRVQRDRLAQNSPGFTVTEIPGSPAAQNAGPSLVEQYNREWETLVKSATGRAVAVNLPRENRVAILRPDDPLVKALLHGEKDGSGVVGIGAEVGISYKTRRAPTFDNLAGASESDGIMDRGDSLKRLYDMERSASFTPFFGSYLTTRTGQLENWWHHPRYRMDRGYRVGMRQIKAQPTPAQLGRIEEITKILDQCGTEKARREDGHRGIWDASGRRLADAFPVLLSKIWRDAARFGVCAVEIEHSAGKKPFLWARAIDASTVRKVALPAPKQLHYYTPQLRTDAALIEYVTVDATGLPVREFSREDLLFKVRRPITDETAQDYGFSDLEILVEVLGSIAMGMAYNREIFTANHVPPGVFVQQYMGAEKKAAWEKVIRDNVGGAGKWHKFLTLFIEQNQTVKPEWINFNGPQDKGDMFWKDYVWFLVNLMCAALTISPEEMGFQGFSNKSSSLGEANPQAKITQSQAKGLYNHLLWLADFGTDLVNIIEPSGEFALFFDSMDDRDVARELEMAEKRMRVGLTLPCAEQSAQDEPIMKIALDRDLWEKCRKEIGDKAKGDAGEEIIDDAAVEKLYEEKDGKYSIAPFLPIEPTMQGVVIQELQAAGYFGQPQDQMGPGDGGGQGQPWQEAQQGAPQGQESPQQEDRPEWLDKSLAAKPIGYKYYEIRREPAEV